MFVIDTNVASELMRPQPMPAVATWIEEREAGDIYLTAVSEAELLYGVAIMPTGRRRTEIVVTHEVPADTTSKIKIPNACIGLGLRCMSPYEMLRRERARFVLGRGNAAA